MNLFLWLGGYAHPHERKTDRFLKWLRSTRSDVDVQRRLLELMRENFLATSLWLEKKFKNYHALSRRARKLMYKNAEIIENKFTEYLADFPYDEKRLTEMMHRFDLPMYPADAGALQCLMALTQFFSQPNSYTYRIASGFHRLLVDPTKEPMVGDCNQIVTLYTHLFSRHFPIDQLQIKLLPDHVCLHFKGLDIEATTGAVTVYEKFEYIAPITELVATNLLDVADPEETAQSVVPEVFVKGAHLARATSSRAQIVEHNLRVAYHNLCIAALKQNNLPRAYFYADQSGERQLIESCWSQEFNSLASSVKNVTSLADARAKKATYRKMLELARNLHDKKNEQQIQKILQQIS